MTVKQDVRALWDELSAIEIKADAIRDQIREEIAALEAAERGLPTEEGIYMDRDGQLYRLHIDGDWSDGWGNPLEIEDVGDGMVRLEPIRT